MPIALNCSDWTEIHATGVGCPQWPRESQSPVKPGGRLCLTYSHCGGIGNFEFFIAGCLRFFYWRLLC